MHAADDALPLGREVDYPTGYAPEVLRAIPRERSTRTAAYGADYWTAHEHTWLNQNGKPRCGVLRLRVPFVSPSFVESKSLKLYLVSFALTRFASIDAMCACIAADVGACCGASIDVTLSDAGLVASLAADRVGCDSQQMLGVCIDDADISCSAFVAEAHPQVAAAGAVRAERVHSHLLRSLCPVTGQPDHGTLVIDCQGPPLQHAALLRYIVGFRVTHGFHEQLIDTIYAQLSTALEPERLCVMGLFCRRGGIDITPVRSSRQLDGWPPRVPRQ